jgi:hypothetical protein
LEALTVEKYAAGAARAFDPDVGAGAIHPEIESTARVFPLHAVHLADVHFHFIVARRD